MNGNVPSIRQSAGALDNQQIMKLLQDVQRQLDDEIQAKQQTISSHEREIMRLHQLLENNTDFFRQKDERLMLLERENEGNRQLINKLLGDIEGLHRDIEWYKRTYEKRSLLGTIKEKLFRRRR